MKANIVKISIDIIESLIKNLNRYLFNAQEAFQLSTYSRTQGRTALWLHDAWTSMDWNLKRLMLVSFVESLAVTLYASVLMPYYRSLGFASDTAGVLTSIIQVVSAVSGVAAGFMADSLGRKRLYTAGQLLRCLAAALLLTTRSYAGLVAVSVVRGIAIIQSPAQSAMLASYTRKETRGTHYGIVQTVGMAAQVIGPLAAGLMADRFGVKAAFGSGFLLACLAVLVALPLKDKGPGTENGARADASPDGTAVVQESAPVRRESPWARIVRMMRENRPVVLCCLFGATILNGLANGATNIVLPFTIMDRFSSAYTTVSSSQAVGSIGTMLVLLIGGRIADVYGRRRLILSSGASFPLLMLGLFLVQSLWQLFALIIVLTMIGNISSPAMSAVYMEAVGESDRATFAGLQLGLNSAAMALGMIGSGVGYKFSPTATWVAIILAFALQLPLYAAAIPGTKSARASENSAPSS